MSEIAGRHRAWAELFTSAVDGVTDWDAPTPVSEWTARDVVRHLVEWPPGLLASQGSTHAFPEPPSADDDPATAWRVHRDGIQALLDDGEASGEVLQTQMVGEARTDEILERFYLPDVYWHTWDVTRASGRPDSLDDDQCAQMLAGMRGIEEMLRQSGQFGEQQPVPDDATPTEQLMAFLGRDPRWAPTTPGLSG